MPSASTGPSSSRSKRRRYTATATMLAVAVALGSYGIVRSIGAKERAATSAANREPMARYVPRGAKLTSTIVQPTSWLSGRRSATIVRSFDVPRAALPGVFAATLSAARATGWSFKRVDHETAYGVRARAPGLGLEIIASVADPGTETRHLFVTIDSAAI